MPFMYAFLNALFSIVNEKGYMTWLLLKGSSRKSQKELVKHFIIASKNVSVYIYS